MKPAPEEMAKAIVAFVKGQRTACDEWKRQPHIRPLFDIAKKLAELNEVDK